MDKTRFYMDLIIGVLAIIAIIVGVNNSIFGTHYDTNKNKEEISELKIAVKVITDDMNRMKIDEALLKQQLSSITDQLKTIESLVRNGNNGRKLITSGSPGYGGSN